MNADKYLFFLDIDNTLWSRGEIPEINKETIKQVRAMGHKVFVNTGRSYGFIPSRLFDQVELDGVISGIGGTIRIDGEIIEKAYLSKDDVPYLFELFKDKADLIIYEGEYDVIYFDGFHKENLRFFRKENGEQIYFSIEEWKEKYLDKPISKVTVHGYSPTKEESEALSVRFELIPQVVDKYIEIGVLGHSKAFAMLRVAEILGVDRSHCVAMGDSPNDLSMLRAAGISVAMGNAYDSIKKVCDIVSVDCIDGGVAHAMKKILKI